MTQQLEDKNKEVLELSAKAETCNASNTKLENQNQSLRKELKDEELKKQSQIDIVSSLNKQIEQLHQNLQNANQKIVDQSNEIKLKNDKLDD